MKNQSLRQLMAAALVAVATGVVLWQIPSCTPEQLSHVRSLPPILHSAATVLEQLADTDQLDDAFLIRIALEQLDAGNLEACCETLRKYLEVYEDPRVQAVLALLETQALD